VDEDTVSTAPVRQVTDAYGESYRPDVCRQPLGIELAEVPQVEVSQDRINLRGGREPLNPLLSQWAPTDVVGERSLSMNSAAGNTTSVRVGQKESRERTAVESRQFDVNRRQIQRIEVFVCEGG
jgi:hypothetical protein